MTAYGRTRRSIALRQWLAERCATQQPATVRDLLTLAADVAGGLQALHAAGAAHAVAKEKADAAESLLQQRGALVGFALRRVR